jgi:aryl-alcohol dehydrogenase-like predicted oxidoreductase
MRNREFGRLGRISALTLGGGGIGGVWGRTDRREAVATIHAAIDAGITMLDVAPGYGVDAESERAVGEALKARPNDDVMVTTKVPLPDQQERDYAGRIRRGLDAGLDRIGRDQLDLLMLHSQIRPAGSGPEPAGTIGFEAYRDEVVPEFERLRAAGKIRAWGITGVGHPEAVAAAMRAEQRPDAVQVTVNALDLDGDIWMWPGTPPQNERTRRIAGEHGVAVVAIRAVAAGSLTSGLDRELDPDHPAARDFRRAEPFRKLAAELGERPAALAHRYALSVPGVATVVLGVKNRHELAECAKAEARGPLSDTEMSAIAGIQNR